MKSLYTLHDLLAKQYSLPFESANDDCAQRFAKQFVLNQKFALADFRLVFVGEFDEFSGSVNTEGSGKIIEWKEGKEDVENQ